MNFPPYRIVFMGTPEFAVPALQALHAAGAKVVAVYTQPPRPAGRGLKLKPSAVAELAASLGIVTETPLNFRNPEDVAKLNSYQPD